MITISKENLKSFDLPFITSGKLTKEQARVLAEIIYNVIARDNEAEKEKNNTKVA